MMSGIRIDPKQLEIKAEPRRPAGMTEDHAKRVEEIVFTAYYEGKDVGHATVDRFVGPTAEESSDPFFADQEFNPPRPIPFVFFLVVDNEFRRYGVATALLSAANAHYKLRYGIPLHSTTCVPKPTKENGDFGAEPLWEALVREGLAEEISYAGVRRWKLL